MMSAQTQANINTAIQVAAALAPVVGASSPQGAAVVALAPIALDLLNAAVKAQSVGLMTADQLAQWFSTVGANIQSTHNEWIAMDAADAAKAA
jgi:hypothetical protein